MTRNEVFASEDPEAIASRAARRDAESRGLSNDLMRDEFGIEIPAEVVPLPSGGQIYPSGHPLSGKKTLQITGMTAREEDILTSAALIKQGTVITELIRSCVVDKRIRPENLLSGDRNALMVAIRITGYGREYNAEITCEDCKKKSESLFDLASLPISELKLEPLNPGENLFEFELPRTRAKVHFSFLTGRDEEELSKENERRKKKLKIKTESLVTSRLTRCIKSVNGISDKNKIAQFVRRMPAVDSRALRNHIEQHEPGIEMKTWTKCEHCGEDQMVAMPLGPSFFWPDA